MPRYRVVTSPTFANGNLHAVGDEIEFAGWPGSTLDPVDAIAERVKKHFATRRRDRKLPRLPDLLQFAAEEPETRGRKAAVKEPTDG